MNTKGADVLDIMVGESIWSGGARGEAIPYCDSDILGREWRGRRVE